MHLTYEKIFFQNYPQNPKNTTVVFKKLFFVFSVIYSPKLIETKGQSLEILGSCFLLVYWSNDESKLISTSRCQTTPALSKLKKWFSRFGHYFKVLSFIINVIPVAVGSQKSQNSIDSKRIKTRLPFNLKIIFVQNIIIKVLNSFRRNKLNWVYYES